MQTARQPAVRQPGRGQSGVRQPGDTGDTGDTMDLSQPRTATGRYKRYGLGSAPPYPVLAPVEKRRAPLIMGVLSTIVVVALLFGVGAVLLGRHAGTAHASSTASLGTHATPSVQTVPNTLYQSALLGTASGWISDAHCAIKADGYHITGASLCYAPVGAQGNVDISVTAKQVNGPLNLLYGIVLRQTSGGNYYFFGIDGNGKWTFTKFSNNTNSFLVHPTNSSAIKGNLNQANTLEVKGVGSHFQFFVNGTNIGQSDDTTYASGLIGLTSGNGVEVAYTNITITQLPG